ncbi:MAG: hypothetical protein IPJ88_10095 [Myxococcales bacterium]|nr:MAG: hypothetical protein IPJ88_10095 [Myxococcales bacterium]
MRFCSCLLGTALFTVSFLTVSCTEKASTGVSLDAGSDQNDSLLDSGQADVQLDEDVVVTVIDNLANGSTCASDEQCVSGFCHPSFDRCQTPDCFDGFQNGDETALDCGGGCVQCGAIGAPCVQHDDCDSGYCSLTNHCLEPSCFDGFQNGDETGVDCGGSCGACSPCSSLAQQDPEYETVDTSAYGLVAGNAQLVLDPHDGSGPFRFNLVTELGTALSVNGVAADKIRVSGMADDGGVVGWYETSSGSGMEFRAVYWAAGQNVGTVLWTDRDAKAIAVDNNPHVVFLERVGGAVSAKIVKLSSSAEHDLPIATSCGYPRDLRVSPDELSDERELPAYVTGTHVWDDGFTVVYTGGFWGSVSGSGWGTDLYTGNGQNFATATDTYARTYGLRRYTYATNGLYLVASVVGALGPDEASVQAAEWTLDPLGLAGAHYTRAFYEFEVPVDRSVALSVNASSMVVGVATVTQTGTQRAWIGNTTEHTVPANYEQFLDTQVPTLYEKIPKVYGIDNDGNILAEAERQENTQVVTFFVVLKPLPSPSSGVLYDVVEIAAKN